MHKYTDEYLIKRLYTELENIKNNNTNLSKLSLQKPNIHSINKKTFFNNFSDICNNIIRDREHIRVFFENELQTKTSIDQKGALIINGIFKINAIQKNLEQYIKIYVQCGECLLYNTNLIKEKGYLYLDCNNCKSKKCINN